MKEEVICIFCVLAENRFEGDIIRRPSRSNNYGIGKPIHSTWPGAVVPYQVSTSIGNHLVVGY